jgi:diguanylate cyclase (GGDEF)-like protein
MVTPAIIAPRTRFVLGVLVVLLCGTACRLAPAGETPRPLAGPWKFHLGDDPVWAQPETDDRAWTDLQVPKSWGRQGFDHIFGLAWYRSRVSLPWPANEPVALALGKIDSAYEVYVGGRRLGGVGQLPPSPVMEYDRHRIYIVPASTREPDGSIVIALRVWRADGKSAGAAGPVEGPFEVGPIGPILERDKLAEAAQLALVLLFVGVAVFHLVLRMLQPEAAAYGWFGLLALESAVYAFLRTQWKYMLFDDFVTLKKVEHLMIFLVPVTFLQFLWVFFGRPVPRGIRLLQVGLLGGGAVALLTPGLETALGLLPGVQVAAFGAAGAGTVFVLPFIRAGDPEARLLGLGALAVVLTIGSDFLIERNVYVAPRTVIYGFALLVFGMSLALANRFHRVLADADSLRRELEQRVETRTQELSAAYSRMEELALRDGLTGLLNRRAMQDRARAGLAQARRRQSPFALAMIDVDHFKAINDTYGHAAGDQVLGHVARVLSGAVRASDEVGRWGGEEFLVLLPDADAGEAAVAAERLREQIAVTEFHADARPIAVTVSIGVAILDGPRLGTTGLDVLIRVADAALYHAKAQGRNRVAVSG